jgi:ABC-type phosphate transport system auxiliary subunit
MTPSGKQTPTATGIMVRLLLPAEVLAHYEGMAQFARRPVEDLLAQQLQRFADHDVRDRVLVLNPQDREKLEELLSKQLPNAKVLIEQVGKLTTLKVGPIAITLEQWQLEELKRRAEKNGVSVAATLDSAAKQISHLVFNGSGV